MREWTVAGAVIESDCLGEECLPEKSGVLLVENARQGGHRDWTTPGGVIDAGENYRSGLVREVREETGLVVVSWSELLYTVTVEAPGLDWTLTVEVHRAGVVEGELLVGGDPDGIVVAADWANLERCGDLLAQSPRWVSEPLLEWVEQRFESPRSFEYQLEGSSPRDYQVSRVSS